MSKVIASSALIRKIKNSVIYERRPARERYFSVLSAADRQHSPGQSDVYR